MGSLAAWGYGLASGVYASLTVLLLVVWQGRIRGLSLIAAMMATSIWAGVLALSAAGRIMSPAILLTETLRQAVWLAVMASLVRTQSVSAWLARAVNGILVAAVATVIAVGSIAPQHFRPVVMVASIALSTASLALLEQSYRSAGDDGRWALRYLYIGIGLMAVFDLFIYAEALLFGVLGEAEWAARGFVYCMVAPAIVVAARRNPYWSLRVFVSRQIAFFATSAFLVGGYLLLMAAGGYAVQALGGQWGAVLQLVFLAAAAGILASLIGSENLRRQVRVQLVKHFYRHKYEYRDEWLRFISTLSTARNDEEREKAPLLAVAQIIDSPRAVYWSCRSPANGGGAIVEWPREHEDPARVAELGRNQTLLDMLGEREWVVDLADYRSPAGPAENSFLPDWLLKSSWRLIVPAMLGDRLQGFLMLAEPKSRFELTFEDRDLLKTVARHVATYRAQHEAEQKVAEVRQFEAYSKLTAFILHDLKNVSAQLDLVDRNAERHAFDPEFVEDAFATVRGVSVRLAGLLETLRCGGDTGRLEPVALLDVLDTVVTRCADRDPRPEMMPACQAPVVKASSQRLGELFEHVIRNGQDATGVGGHVKVHVEDSNGWVRVTVEDDGAGMTPEFIRDGLFRPFHSTKGARGMGIGAYQVREYVHELGGQVSVRSSPGAGTRFEIALPMVTPSRIM